MKRSVESKVSSSSSSSKRAKVSEDADDVRSISEWHKKVRQTSDKRVTQYMPLIPSACLVDELPLSEKAAETVMRSRQEVQDILDGHSDKIVVVCGPCSINNVDSALEYAKLLAAAREKHAADLSIVMRVYFEKPRTSVGWKGLINDPFLDGTFKINTGLRLGRKLLLDINELGLPCGCEFLDTISPQYTADLVSWGAIGARTTECQLHRELVSGLSMPVGFKNGTSGAVKVAVDACTSAKSPHRFLGITKDGVAAIVSTSGNEHVHVILRGGSDGPNYDAVSVAAAGATMAKNGFRKNVIVDCSHGNSRKVFSNQPVVASDIASQLGASGESSDCIVGVMLESNLVEGNQKLSPGVTDPKTLVYGLSVTDGCIDWSTTEGVLDSLAAGVRARRENRKAKV